MTLVAEDGRRTEGDEIWRRLRSEAGAVMTTEPALGGLVLTSILDRVDFADAVLHRLAMRLARDALSMDLLLDAFRAALASDPEIEDGFRADIVAVVDRDPACERLIEPFLFFKGWSAIQTHRLAHRLWLDGRLDLALTLQSRSSETFQTDIHPAAVFGTGIFLDHATGLVVGETAVLEDEISLLQDVTLGGTGKATGDRHPKILHGSLIGAGAKILGAITVGPGARVAAGSVVLKPVAPHTTVAGIPARVVGGAGSDDPSKTMDQNLPDGGYASFTYMI
ncbi:serine O-acetyltransferase [Siculibacillus lacustris]|nr:serine O-acetyltransferase [Siculibacillus lacustris]